MTNPPERNAAGAPETDLIRVGHIAGPHGIRGEVLIKSYTGIPEDIGSYGPLESQTGDTIVIRKCRTSSKGIVATLQGVTSRNVAEALKGTQLHISRDKLPAPDEDEWYITDLIGLTVEDEKGTNIGSVLTVHDFGAGELLELDLKGRPQSLLVPFTLGTVPDIRIEERRLTVHLTPDLLGDEPEDEDST